MLSPFIVNVFLPMRNKAYQRLVEDGKRSDRAEQKMKLKLFIEKFEIEYIDLLRTKLLDKYIDYIQHKRYNMPCEVDIKELKQIGASVEVDQLSAVIAEWSLELEIISYTIEGLKLYELQDPKTIEKKDYMSALKYGYNYQKEQSFRSISECVIRKAVTFTLTKVSSIALMRGLTKIRFGSKAIIEIFFMFTLSNRVPWSLIVNYLNLPWVLGGLVCSLLLRKLSEYATRDEVLSNLQEVLETFEGNRTHLMSERKDLLDTVFVMISKPSDSKNQIEAKKISKIINNLLNPDSKSLEANEATKLDVELTHNIEEVDDYVVVEEKDHKENVDKTGVLIVDW